MSRSPRHRLLAAILGGLFVAAGGASADAQSPAATARPASTEEGKTGFRLVEESGSRGTVAAQQKQTAAELRQARAWERSQRRIARIEAAKDAGYHLSRPPAVAVPSMTSRYPYPRTWIVPVYIYPAY